ncbi:MAG: universal stress protein [Erythrobacter sp.]
MISIAIAQRDSVASNRRPAVPNSALRGKALHCWDLGWIPMHKGESGLRTFLVVIDESDEARAALRYAARRSVAVDGAVHILALVPQQNMNAFSGVQATLEQEARDRAEMLAHSVAGNLLAESGIMPTISVKIGNAQKIVSQFLKDHLEVAALVLGASKGSNPGPLVAHFSSSAGTLHCPLYVIPESYDENKSDHVA